MSLNILQHKSWHVWTQKNIEKVRKDQEEHRKQEDRKRKRELDIEQERRLEALRERNKRLKGEPVDDDSGPSSLVIVKQEEGERALVTGPGERRRGKAVAVKHEREQEQEVAVVAAAEEPLKHVNFFEDLELQQRAEDTRNPEHEAEKKAQADRDARFYTTYLGQSAAETQKVKPWYYGPPVETPALPPEKERKQQRFKAEKDPLSAMGVFLQRKKQIESIQAMHANGSTGTPAMLARSMKIAAQMSAATTTTTITAASSTTLSTTGSADTKEKKEKKDKKDKKKEKKRRKKREEKKKRRKSRKHESSSSSDSDSDSSSSDDDDDGAAEAKKLKLLQLRAERMRREAEAKGKTRQLLFGNSQGVPTPAVNAGAGQYSSGFAPHIGGILRAQDRERRAQDRERREQHHRHEDRRSSSSSSYSSSSSSSSHHRHRRHYSDSGHLEGRERGGASLRDNY
ncbi:uncharacterized protein ACA1_371740 [Acanthamoeba castellanii str. Neff]|uniref:CBF1-interacting co-repressor CIR N-terminal domain-containing protein n=1 Tax=Acanthamoeba castellanii (strain ATCC 30010 / Neff) TaxID=1257118 RepID=L8GYG4_ACACF|nr:uncharacterized protein ACA1_371740 [Acanthamoeba castellanii str. Neff]ELR18324.1 hypothetical protein ACA1_371740 [Acanthamoeba castellanii str. Neff]